MIRPGLLAVVLLAAPAWAQTLAERATRALKPISPAANPAAQQLDSNRASNRPDVGRPEQSGRAAGGSLLATGEDRNINR